MSFAPCYDVVIAGARPAGAATALLLARAGARVLVLERDAPGTDTLSTHALMRGAVMLLDRWGLLDRLAGTPPVRQTRFVYGAEEIVIDIRAQHGVDALYAPRRTLLDPMLAAAAAEAGAEIRYGAALEDVLRDAGGRVSGAAVRTGAATAAVRAGLVIGADGRRSRLARAVGAEVTTAGRHACATVYAYVAGLRGPRLSLALRPRRGGRARSRPTPACTRSSSACRRRGSAPRPGSIARRCCGEVLGEVHPGLAAEVAAGRFATRPLAFAGEPGFLRRAHGPGWALVGDAGYFKDPLHRPRHHRRPARRRAAGARGAGGGRGGARRLRADAGPAVAAALRGDRCAGRARLVAGRGQGAAPGAARGDEGGAGLAGRGGAAGVGGLRAEGRAGHDPDAGLQGRGKRVASASASGPTKAETLGALLGVDAPQPEGETSPARSGLDWRGRGGRSCSTTARMRCSTQCWAS